MNRKKKIQRMLLLCMVILNNACVCFANEGSAELEDEVLKPIIIIANIFIVIVQALGVLQIIKFYPDLSNGIKDSDFTTGIHGAKGVAAGVVLVFIRKFLKLLGIEWL